MKTKLWGSGDKRPRGGKHGTGRRSGDPVGNTGAAGGGRHEDSSRVGWLDWLTGTSSDYASRADDPTSGARVYNTRDATIRDPVQDNKMPRGERRKG